MSNLSDFWSWADNEIERLNLNWYQVEVKHGLSNGAISKRARDLLSPTLESCKAIARALGLRDVEVLRRAGLIDPEPPTDAPTVREIARLAAELNDEEQEYALKMLRGLKREAT